LLVGTAALVVASFGPAGAQSVDPIAFGVSPPSQTTTPGTQVEITFTVSDVPPCVAGNLTSLDSLDFAVSDPSGLSTIASFTVSEPAGHFCQQHVSGRAGADDPLRLGLPVDEQHDRDDHRRGDRGRPEGGASGTQLTLQGDARGFAAPPGNDYLLTRTGLVLVEEAPPPPPPPSTDPGGNGGGPPVGGEPGSTPAGASGGLRTPAAATATPVRATPRFAG
jgi:hypothetical protein